MLQSKRGNLEMLLKGCCLLLIEVRILLALLQPLLLAVQSIGLLSVSVLHLPHKVWKYYQNTIKARVKALHNLIVHMQLRPGMANLTHNLHNLMPPARAGPACGAFLKQ